MSDVFQERRDRELERTRGLRLVSPFTLKVVGVTFSPGYPDNIRRIVPGQAVELVRDPDNEYDPNAVAVHADNGPVGHLTRPLAARIAFELDAGQAWVAEVVDVLIDPDYPDRPGLSIRCERVQP